MIALSTFRLVLAASVALTSCHARPSIERSAHDGTAARAHPLGVDVVAAPGIVEPRLGEIQLVPLEPGRIDALLVSEGEGVREGMLLARLDDALQRSALAIAEAEVREAAAMLQATASTPEELRLAVAETQAARAGADQAEREALRGRQLVRDGALAGAEAERADSALLGQAALREVAEARLAATRRGASSAERQLARARLESARARLEASRVALARRDVRATVSGVVLWSRRHVGEFVTPGDGPFVVLGAMDQVEARLEVDDLDAHSVALGARCELRGDSGEPLGTARVVRLAPALGARSLSVERVTDRTDTRIREIFVELDQPTRLLPGERVWGYVTRDRRATEQASR